MKLSYLDAEPNGLAAMLGGLIEANLAAHPERTKHLGRPATISVFARDVDVGVSVRLLPGEVMIRNGVVDGAHVRIEGDSQTLVGLSAVPMRFGLPDLTRKEGRDLIRKLLKRDLKVRGIPLHAGKLARLNRLLSVH
ncbi:MAG: hypothetical protein ACRDGU_10440 [Actinomycetota bacterium]